MQIILDLGSFFALLGILNVQIFWYTTFCAVTLRFLSPSWDPKVKGPLRRPLGVVTRLNSARALTGICTDGATFHAPIVHARRKRCRNDEMAAPDYRDPCSRMQAICLSHKDCTQDLESGGRAGIDDMTSERLRTIRTLVGNCPSTKGKDKR